MKTDVLTSGYVSMDHIIKIDTPAKVGISLNAFVVVFQAPLSVAGGR